MTDWKVWGDDYAPVHTGSEQEVKDFVRDADDRDGLYIEDPEGNEYEEDRNTNNDHPDHWRKV